MTCFSNILNESERNRYDVLPSWVDSRYQAIWQDVYEKHELIPIQNESSLISNGYDILQMKIINIEN